MSRPLLLTLALLLPLPVLAAPASTPAPAPAAATPAVDLRYRHDAADHPLLKEYDGESWWTMLASCAGYAMAAADQPGLPADSAQAYQRDGNYYATLASYRYARDHQLPLGIRPEVVEVADRATDRAWKGGLVDSADKRRSMAVLCGAHVSAYERMVPGRGLK